MNKNIVERTIEYAGGVRKLAELHNVSIQSVYLWKRNGYFPLEQMGAVIENFPNISEKDLVDAFRFRCKSSAKIKQISP